MRQLRPQSEEEEGAAGDARDWRFLFDLAEGGEKYRLVPTGKGFDDEGWPYLATLESLRAHLRTA